jgi:hypothetical protein
MGESAAVAGDKLGFGVLLGKSWAVVREHWFALMVATFLRELLAILAAGIVFAIFVDLRGWNFAIALIVKIVVWSVLEVGYLKLVLNLCRTGAIQWKDLFSGSAMLGLQMLMATVCLWLAVVLGLVMLVVPGLIVAARLCLYGLVLVDQRYGALKSLSISNRMIKGFGWQAAGLMLIYCVGSVVVSLVPFAFEVLLVVSLCTLYDEIRAREAKS